MKESSDRHGEAARAANVAIELKPAKLGPTMPKPNMKEMRGDCYTADGRIKGGK